MRGDDRNDVNLFRYISPEALVPKDVIPRPSPSGSVVTNCGIVAWQNNKEAQTMGAALHLGHRTGTVIR